MATFSGDSQDSTKKIRDTLRLSIIEGGFAQAFINWTTGSVLIGYMIFLGASPTELGLVASVPLLAQSVSPFVAYLTRWFGSRKIPTAVLATIGRGLWLLAAVLPQLGIPDAARPAFMVALVLVSSVFQAGAGTLWTAWMSDVVPFERRGRYFGRRTGIVGAVGMLANLAAGWFLDRVAAPLNFQIVLLVSVVCAGIAIYLYFLHYEPPITKSTLTFSDTFRQPLKEPNFRRFLVFAVYWQFSVLIAAPFVFPYFLEALQLSFTQIAIWSVIASCTALFTTIFWGRIADRAGNKAVLAIGTFLAGFALPVCWILAGLTGNLTYIWVSAIFDAFAWGAIGPAIFNLMLVSAPQANRVAFVAMYSLVTGVAGFLGGVLSGPLLILFQQLEFRAFGVQWTGFHWLFVVSGVARMQAWRFLRRVQETNSWRTRDLLRKARFGWRGIGFPWR